MKSHAEDFILNLFNEMLVDAYDTLRSCDPTGIRENDLELDQDYVSRRVRNEGIKFLTTQLPLLDSWVLQRLTTIDEVSRTIRVPDGFAPYVQSVDLGNYPRFLRPFWLRILDSESTHGPYLLQRVRTLLLLCKKLEVGFDESQKQAKLDRYLSCERDLEDFTICKDLWWAQFVAERCLDRYDPSCTRPRHGPGAVAGGEKGALKWEFSTLYASVHDVWPYYDYLYPIRSSGYGHDGRVVHAMQLAASAKTYMSLARVPYPTSRMLFVPKDSKGPRIISCEPKELMYLQQGVASHLVSYLEHHEYTAGHINFADQSINANLALESSRTEAWCTIDLSDASDRVGLELVRYLLPSSVFRKLSALRSHATTLPDGSVIQLRKFAPMGSALCFPVESLVFFALAAGAIWQQSGDFSSSLSSVYVYGDDIIVPTQYYQVVRKMLTAAGLVVNDDKCFWQSTGHGSFRESCGTDAYRGHNVTPHRLRKLPPQQPRDATGIVAWVKYAEQMQSTFPKAARMIIKYLEGLLRRRIPLVASPQSFLSIVSPDNAWTLEQYPDAIWHPETCYYHSKQLFVSNNTKEVQLSNWTRLQRDLLEDLSESDAWRVADRQPALKKLSCSITYI